MYTFCFYRARSKLREDVVELRNVTAEARGRLKLYETINGPLLARLAQEVKSITSRIWRQLLAAYELLKCAEEFSVTATWHTIPASYPRLDPYRVPTKERYESEMNCLDSFAQYVAGDSNLINIDSKSLEALFESAKWFETLNGTLRPSKDRTNVFEEASAFMDKIRSIQLRLWAIIRTSVDSEVWKARRMLAVGVVILTLVLLVSPIFIMLLRHTVVAIQRFTVSLESSTQKLMNEKQKSDLLLSRMLPMPVIRRLRAQRAVPAEAFDAVTIFFSDIVGFTTICATSSPMEVINMLNMLYKLFDEKIMRYNVYKVETIGDAYMVVSGLSQRNDNRHASEIADMSLSFLKSLDGAKVPHRDSELLRIRIGVNTGPCVAGVVGTTMPRYCLFGDSINMASRMESTGEPMKIHISLSTKQALEEVGGYVVESRGLIDVAGKGKMETFWLISKIGGLMRESPQCLHLCDYDQSFLEELTKL